MLIEEQTISEYFAGNAFCADRLFCDLSPQTGQFLTAIKQKNRFKKEEIVFANGQQPCCVYLLREGKAELFTNISPSERNLVRPVGPNEILGLTEAITDLPYETTLKTVRPCLFECIERGDLIRFLQSEPEVCFRLLQLLGASLQKFYQFVARRQTKITQIPIICDERHRRA